MNPLDIKPPGNSIESWVLWLFALVIVMLSGALVKMYFKVLADAADIVVEIKSAKTEASKQHADCQSRYEKLMSELIDLKYKLGMAEGANKHDSDN
jgi:hypothetical protein